MVMKGFYHVWFSTKGRKEALEGELGRDIKDSLRGIAERASIELLELEVVADHAHLLICLTDTQSLASAMHRLKGTSARYIFMKYAELKLDMGQNLFWQKGYGWRKIGSDEVAGIRYYIRTQRERPLRH
jgi:putative transposase